MAEKNIILGYWPIAGRGQAIRYALAIVGAHWQDKLYTDRTEWFDKDKKSLGFKFPNLPYLIDGETKVTESAAILRYIAKKFHRDDLLGKTPEDYALVESFIGVLGDITSAVSPLMFSADPKAEVPKAYEKIKDKLDQLEHNIVGPTALPYLTIADLKIASAGELFLKVLKDKAGDYKKIQGIVDHVLNLPEVHKYREKGVTLLVPPTSKLLE